MINADDLSTQPQMTDDESYIGRKTNRAVNKPDISTTAAALSGFNRNMGGRLAEGATQLGLQGIGKVGQGMSAIGIPGGQSVQDFSQSGLNSLSNLHNQNEAYNDQAAQQHPIAQGIGAVSGAIGQASTLPLGMGGTSSMVGRIGANAALGAGLGGAAYIDPTSASPMAERGMNAVQGGLVGGAVGGLVEGGRAALDAAGQAMPGAANMVKGFLPQDVPFGNRNAQESVANGIASRHPNILSTPGSLLNDNGVQASQRLGVQLSPGQILQDPILVSAEQRINPSPENQAKIYKILTNNEQNTKMALKQAVDSTISEGDDYATALKDSLYFKAHSTQVPTHIQEDLQNNPFIKKQIAGAMKDDNFNLAQENPATLRYWDILKQYMDDQRNQAAASGQNNLARKFANSDGTGAINTIKDQMDALSNEYPMARDLAKRLIWKNGFMDQLDQLKLAPGQDAPTTEQLGNQAPIGASVKTIYNKLLGSREQQQDFLDSVRSAKGNVQQAKDVITVMNRLQTPTMNRVLSNSPESTTSKMGGGFGAAAREMVMDLYNGKQNGVIADLFTDPQWAKTLSKIVENSSAPRFLDKFANLITRVAAESPNKTQDMLNKGGAMMGANMNNGPAPGASVNPQAAQQMQQPQGQMPSSPNGMIMTQ